MTNLRVTILLLIATSANCCDEKACRYGTAIGKTVSDSFSPLGALSCPATGVGCFFAIGGVVASAFIQFGSKFCGECSKDSIPLEKLDQILLQEKKKFSET